MSSNVLTSAESAKSSSSVTRDAVTSKSNNTKFDDICLKQLCDVFGKDDKWKIVASKMGYQAHLDSWEKSRNPTKMLFMFSEVSDFLNKNYLGNTNKLSFFFNSIKALRVPKDSLINIFTELGEHRAVQIVNEWKMRSSC